MIPTCCRCTHSFSQHRANGECGVCACRCYSAVHDHVSPRELFMQGLFTGFTLGVIITCLLLALYPLCTP